MKVFFDASPREFDKYGSMYKSIAEIIEKAGHQHTSRFFFDFDKFSSSIPKNQWMKYYKPSIDKLQNSDVAVFEITVSSLATGQLLQYALIAGKPVIALHTSDYYPNFLEGAEEVESKLQVIEYKTDNLEKLLINSLKDTEDWLESRFTLILNSRIKSHLDKVAETGKSRSEYIRNLIEEKMKETS